MAENFIKNKSEIVRKKKKKKKIKKFMFAFIFLVSLFITLALKLSYFNVNEIKVHNNKNVSIEEIISLSNINKGSNIFYINTNKSMVSILKNSYILDVNIKRKLPSNIDITVVERVASFYCVKDNGFLIIGKDGVVMEEKQNLSNNDLIKLLGFDINKATVGKTLPSEDNRKISAIGTITDFVNSPQSKFKISSVDISDLLNIRVYYENMYVKLGTSENLEEKLRKAVIMLELEQLKPEQLKGVKGIDVSVIAKPVFCIEE